jgi:hypothetical protein
MSCGRAQQRLGERQDRVLQGREPGGDVSVHSLDDLGDHGFDLAPDGPGAQVISQRLQGLSELRAEQAKAPVGRGEPVVDGGHPVVLVVQSLVEPLEPGVQRADPAFGAGELNVRAREPGIGVGQPAVDRRQLGTERGQARGQPIEGG